MPLMKTLIIDNFDSFTYNIFQYSAELRANPAVFKNNEISLDEIKKGHYTHIIISPGPGSPENKKDFGICEDAIEEFKDKLPILGVCLGHQGIAYHFGGKVIKASVPVHGKKSKIRLKNNEKLFLNLPKEIEAMRYHSLIVDRNSFPKDLVIIAETIDDNLIMALKHKHFSVYGIQFHPESIGTKYGKEILKNFYEIKN